MAVISPVLVPNATNGTYTLILVNPTGPSSIVLPAPYNNTSATLNGNCTLTVTDSTGKVTYSTNTTSAGPCQLVMSPNGTMSIIDMSTNTTVWSNNATSNCTPITLVLYPVGVLQEQSCNGTNAVWQGPPKLPPCEPPLESGSHMMVPALLLLLMFGAHALTRTRMRLCVMPDEYRVDAGTASYVVRRTLWHLPLDTKDYVVLGVCPTAVQATLMAT